MPVYAFICSAEECQWRQEKLVESSKRDLPIECPRCGKLSYRQGVTPFATPSIVHGAPMTDKEIDLVVGADSESKWVKIQKDKAERHARLQEKGALTRDLDLKPGQKFNPLGVIGDEKRKALGNAYTEAAKERIRSGVDFDGTSLKTK